MKLLKEIIESFDTITLDNVGQDAGRILGHLIRIIGSAQDPDGHWDYNGLVRDVLGSNDRQWQKYSPSEHRKFLNMLLYILREPS